MQRVSWRDDFAGAILFGSRARHSHHAESDADVAVLLAGAPGEYVRTKLELDDLAYEVLFETGNHYSIRQRVERVFQKNF